MGTLKRLVRGVLRRKAEPEFTTSGEYWEQRYVSGGTSGAGSYGHLAAFKSEVLNDFIAKNGIASVIEWGPGDGNQLSLLHVPTYVGVDVSATAVEACRKLFAADASKSFITLADYDGRKAELSLSLDVIYHLIEDATYESYMANLFDSAERFVIVYSSDKDEQHRAQHVRHRKFTDWVGQNRPEFSLTGHVPNRYPFNRKDRGNTSFADFYIFEKTGH